MNEFETDRLRLRPVRAADLPVLVRLWTDGEVRRYLGGPLACFDAERRVAPYVGVRNCWVATERWRGEVLGLCSLGPYRASGIEISYQFLPEVWGRGYAREALTAVIAWGFAHLAVDRLIAVTQTANIRSRRLLEALGLRIVDEFIEHGAPQTMYALDRRQPDASTAHGTRPSP